MVRESQKPVWGGFVERFEVKREHGGMGCLSPVRPGFKQASTASNPDALLSGWLPVLDGPYTRRNSHGHASVPRDRHGQTRS